MTIHGIQFLGAGHLAPNPHWKMRPHLHPFHELIVIFRGRMQVKSLGTTRLAEAGDVLLYPARVIHEECSNPDRPVEIIFLSFKMASLRAHHILKTQDLTGRIRQMTRWLYEDKHSSAPHVQEERQAFLQAIMTELFRGLNHRDHPLIARTRQYVMDHIADPLSLEALARQAHWSQCHFLRTYKTLTGRTPMEDVRMIRANYARELILSTSLPLKDIAPQAGLGNEYSLSRIFRRYFNMPPGAWRRHRNLPA